MRHPYRPPATQSSQVIILEIRLPAHSREKGRCLLQVFCSNSSSTDMLPSTARSAEECYRKKIAKSEGRKR